jgi:hypothetical protein
MADLFTKAIFDTYDNAGSGVAKTGDNANRSVVYYPNAAVTIADPFSQFGTRELTFAKITGVTGVGDSSTAAASKAARLQRAIATVAEVFFFYTPAANVAAVAYAANTNNGGGEGNTNNDRTIAEAIDLEFASEGYTSTVATALTSVFQTS